MTEHIVQIGEGVKLFAINGIGQRRELKVGSSYRHTDCIVVQIQGRKDDLDTSARRSQSES